MDLKDLIPMVVSATLDELEKRKLLRAKSTVSVYDKTEWLLMHFNDFKLIIREHDQSMEDDVKLTTYMVERVENGLKQLRYDPYFKILEMRYFEGRTLEDIAYEYNTSAMTISRQRHRLVKELSLRVFPDETVGEMVDA